MNSINVTGDLIKLQRSQSTWKCEIVMIFYSSRILSRLGKTANAQRILTAVAWFGLKEQLCEGRLEFEASFNERVFRLVCYLQWELK